MLSIKFLSLSLLLSLVSASPFAAPAEYTGPYGLSVGVLRPEDLPAGAKIEIDGYSTAFHAVFPTELVGFEAELAQNSTETASPNEPEVAKRMLMKRDSADCKGSAVCAAGVTYAACQNAINRFEPNTWFCGSRRRYFAYNGGTPKCLAIFEPNSNVCLQGNTIRDYLRKVYSVGGCGKCGRFFNSAGAFRLDYCANQCSEW